MFTRQAEDGVGGQHCKQQFACSRVLGLQLGSSHVAACEGCSAVALAGHSDWQLMQPAAGWLAVDQGSGHYVGKFNQLQLPHVGMSVLQGRGVGIMAMQALSFV